MLNERLQEFFKKHNLYDREMFHYLTKIYDETDYYDNAVCCICVYPKINVITHKIDGVSLTLPYIYDEITHFIAMQEIAKAIYYYKNIGRTYKPLEEELFAKRIEMLYLAEYASPALEHYLAQPTLPSKKTQEREKFVADNNDALLDIDLTDMNVVRRESRRLLRQWEKNSR